jgi:hypothetical protein
MLIEAVIPAKVPCNPLTHCAPDAGKLVVPFELSVPSMAFATPWITRGLVFSEAAGVTVRTPFDPTTQRLLLPDSWLAQLRLAAPATPEARPPTTPAALSVAAPSPAAAAHRMAPDRFPIVPLPPRLLTGIPAGVVIARRALFGPKHLATARPVRCRPAPTSPVAHPKEPRRVLSTHGKGERRCVDG